MALLPGRAEADRLRVLLASQVEATAQEALRSGGAVPEQRLDELSRLARLVEMRDAAPGWRWAALAVGLVTLTVASILLFVRMPSTEVEIELKASELSFVVPEADVLTDIMTVSAIALSGLEAVRLPGAAADTDQPAATVSLAAERLGARSGSVSLDPIEVPAGARVTLQNGEGRHRYGMIIQGAGPRLGLSVSGPLRLRVPRVVDQVSVFPFPRRIELEADRRQLSLYFTPADSAAGRKPLRAPLPAASLELWRVDRFHQGERTYQPRVPTVLSGTVYYESLDGQARPLRPGEGLYLASSEGQIRELALEDDGIRLRFHGVVRGMTTGSGEVRRSLMPTVVDWLRARHGLTLLWGTTASAVGLFLTIAGWWRRTAA